MLRLAMALAATMAALAQNPAFEVASIRLNKEGGQASIGPAPGGLRFVARNMPTHWLIAAAYNISIRQIEALPDAFRPREYDIEAKCSHPSSRTEMMAMLRTLLEERFKLRVRRERRELRAYVLTVAKGGPRLQENRDGAPLEMRRETANRFAYRNFPMPLLASILTDPVDNIVIDKTGLAAGYDFTLEFRREKIGPGAIEGREPVPDPGAPSIFTALQRQLGLDLKSEKTMVDVIVVEKIEEPSNE